MSDQVPSQSDSDSIAITVCKKGDETTHLVEPGSNLREELLKKGYEVYGSISKRANCGGRGLCATCGVRLDGPDGAPKATHWHDSTAQKWGYPRLSCQVTVDEPLSVTIVDKMVWGQLLPRPETTTDD
jgi:ferredoxin